MHELHAEQLGTGAQRHGVCIASVARGIETIAEQLAYTAGGQNHRPGFDQQRLSIIIDADRSKAAPAVDDEIYNVGVFDDAGVCSLNYRLLSGDNAIRAAGVGVGRHGGEHLALKLEPHFMKTLDRIADFGDENATQLRVGHSQAGLQHVAVHELGWIKKAALRTDGSHSPEVT